LGRPYVSTDSATIFIAGFWLDDAKGIEWQVQDPKQPLYGYRSFQFDDVAMGQTLVHGMLDLNFRYKGYLAMVLARLQDLKLRNTNLFQGLEDDTGVEGAYRQLLQQREQQNDFRSQGIDPRKIAPADYGALLATPHQQFNVNGFNRLAEAMREEFWDEGSQEALNQAQLALNQRPRAGTFNLEELDLKIAYKQTDPTDALDNEDSGMTYTLKGVRFVSQSQVLTNNVPGGGEPIIERYQFIAREIV
jgi:hypothetical protein